jgi:hypothetical protein
MLRALIAIFFVIALPLHAESGVDGCAKEVKQLDAQIQKLIKERDMHGQKAQEYQHKGDSWQYETGNIQTGYENWEKANQERSKMLEIQNQIDALEKRKQRIFQFYPQLQYPNLYTPPNE